MRLSGAAKKFLELVGTFKNVVHVFKDKLSLQNSLRVGKKEQPLQSSTRPDPGGQTGSAPNGQRPAGIGYR